MPQDAFTLRLVANELNNSIKGGKVSKIVEPNREEVALYIYTKGRTLKLFLNVNASDCGAYFLNEEPKSPAVPPNFCMLLRKHLVGAEVLSVGLAGFERILELRFLCRNDFKTTERTLCAEIMGKYSNLILTEDGIIMGALKTTSLDISFKRMILSGARYVLPEPQDKANPLDDGALSDALSRPEGDLANFLFTRVAGLAPSTAARIAQSYRGGDLAKHVKDYLFSDEVDPRVFEKDFTARALNGESGARFATVLDAQTDFYGRRRSVKLIEGKKRALSTVTQNVLKKHEKRLAQTLEKQRECRDCEDLRIRGELITANLYRIQQGMNGLEAFNYYDNSTVRIRLDPLRSPSQNAQDYFKKYRKQKRALEYLVPQSEELRKEIDYLHSVLAAIGCATDETDLESLSEELTAAGLLSPADAQPLKRGKKKPEPKKPEISCRVYEKDGFTVLAGRNNLQNEKLVRAADGDDIWLHAQKYHSCHVVIKTEGRSVPEHILLFAAQICAKYSDGSGDRIPIDYCKIKYVKKPPKSKPGFVIYNNFKTLLVSGASD